MEVASFGDLPPPTFKLEENYRKYEWGIVEWHTRDHHVEIVVIDVNGVILVLIRRARANQEIRIEERLRVFFDEFP